MISVSLKPKPRSCPLSLALCPSYPHLHEATAPSFCDPRPGIGPCSVPALISCQESLPISPCICFGPPPCSNLALARAPLPHVDPAGFLLHWDETPMPQSSGLPRLPWLLCSLLDTCRCTGFLSIPFVGPHVSSQGLSLSWSGHRARLLSSMAPLHSSSVSSL